jgi:Family of unknown function (DUF6533)
MTSNYAHIAAFSEFKAGVRNPANSLLLELVLLAYDTGLTMQHEIRDIWNKKLKLGAAFYLLVRYPMMLYFLLCMFMFTSLKVCFICLHSWTQLRLGTHSKFKGVPYNAGIHTN